MKEHGDKISAEDKSAIEVAKEALKEALGGEDVEAINTKTQTLVEASMKMGEAIYKASQEKQAQEGSTGSEKTEDPNVVDADFEEVKEDDSKDDSEKK